MRPSIVRIIYFKEMLETFRDGRTLVRVVFLPLILYPLFLIAITKLQGAKGEAREAQPTRVAIWGELPASVLASVNEKGRFLFLPERGVTDATRALIHAGTLPRDEFESTPELAPNPSPSEPDDALAQQARALLDSKEVDAVLVAPEGSKKALEGTGAARLAVYVDTVREESALAADRLTMALARAKRSETERRVVAQGLGNDFSRVFSLRMYNVAVSDRRAGQLLGATLPLILLSMCLLGVFMPAIDLSAGEKERGTLETLLCAPIRPFEILVGKFLAVWSVAILMSFANILSLGITLHRILPGDMPVPRVAYAATFGLLFPTTFLFSALFLGIAAFAKDFKEAQNLLMPAYLPLTLLGSVAMVPGVELDKVTALAPVLNVALLIKAVFREEAQGQTVFLTLASTAVYSALALSLAARVFAEEQVLLGGRESAKALLRQGDGAMGGPTVLYGLFIFCLSQSASFYGSSLLERQTVLVQVVSIQSLFLVTSLGAVFARRYDAKGVFAWRLPAPLSWLGALVMGATAWSLAALTTRLVPPTAEFAETLRNQLLSIGGPVRLVLVLALLPAFCEETLFRGFLFSALRPLGKWTALFGSAVLFGLAHGSVYRLLPTATLGIVLGLVRERTRSLWPGMLIHATNNGLLLLFTYYAPESPLAQDSVENVPLSWLALAIGLFSVGALIVAKSERQES